MTRGIPLVAALAVASAVWLAMPPPVSATRTAWSPSWRRVQVGVGVVVMLVATPRGWLPPVLVVAAGGAGALALWRRRVRAGESQRNAALMAEVCELVAAELAAGRPAEAALGEGAVVWPRLGHVAEVCRLGGDVPTALREASRIPGAEGLRLLAAAWVVAHRTGGGLAAMTRRVAGAVRRDQSARRVVLGELASARATARLVAVLPVFVLLMGSGAGADPWSFLLRTPAGWACWAGGVAAGLAGLWWIELLAGEVDHG
jgi:tight adherence protein B